MSKIGGKCRRTFFHEKNPLFLRKINPTAYHTRILGQFLVRHVQTPSHWKRKLRTRVFPLLHISYSVFIFPLFSNFLPFFLFISFKQQEPSSKKKIRANYLVFSIGTFNEIYSIYIVYISYYSYPISRNIQVNACCVSSFISIGWICERKFG